MGLQIYGPLDSPGEEDSAAWEEKRVPPGVSPWGCCLLSLAGWWRQTPPLPSPSTLGLSLLGVPGNDGWGQGRLLRGAGLLGPTRKEADCGESFTQ